MSVWPFNGFASILQRSRFRPVKRRDARLQLEHLEERAVPAGLTPNQKFVSQVYYDLLARQPDPGGLTSWSALVDQGVPRPQIVLGIENSLEYRTEEVDNAYQQLLGRAPDASGLQTGLGVLATYGLQTELAFIASSAEFQALRGGGTVSGWLNAIYSKALGRAVDSGASSVFTADLSTGRSTYQQVATVIFTSLEFDNNLLAHVPAPLQTATSDPTFGYYWGLLLRAPDPAGQAAWAAALQSGASPESVIAGLLGSDEFYNLVQGPMFPYLVTFA